MRKSKIWRKELRNWKKIVDIYTFFVNIILKDGY